MKKYFDRELSWLSFNYRVLQEAINEEVPLIERIRFLAIYSSNLDEFYRVRVASYMHVLKLQKKNGVQQDTSILKLLKKIKKIVDKQQNEFGEIFKNKLTPSLEKEGVFLINQDKIDEKQKIFLQNYFNEKIQPHLIVKDLKEEKNTFLTNKGLYLTIEAISKFSKYSYR